MIRVTNVSKVHRRGELQVWALRDICCEVPEGTFTFILGPSGSGKSTLLYLLGALDEPTGGEIVVGGRMLNRLTAAERDQYRRHDIGFIFQNFNLLSNLTAVENVLVPFMPVGMKRGQKEEAIELLKKVGLGDRLDHRPNQLSGGEQQRVAIARALLKRPKLILADEPTGELDTANSHAILNDLRVVCKERGSTVVVVTHEQEFVHADDHVIRIRDGQVSSGAASRQ
jgi:putative ABC transport system ATP-binding protein